MLLDVLCHLKSEQATELPQSLSGPLGRLCWPFPGPGQPTSGSWTMADGRVCFSSLQAAGTSATAPTPTKASKAFQLRPKSPQVMPIEEFQGKRKAQGRVSPPPTPLSPPNPSAGRRAYTKLRKPSRSSWVKVKPSLSSLQPAVPKGAGSGCESEAQWAAQWGKQSGCQK